MRRQLRVSEAIRHQFATILRDYSWRHNLLQNAHISIMQVKISADLKNATLIILPLNANHYTTEARDALMQALKQETPMLKKELALSKVVRFVPNLKFIWDDSYDISGRIEQLIQQNQQQHDTK
ncbi:MAG: ribosome-binding factor A [Alphaproteobacteria bacterium]|nr:ribosome-binding factor A [Alphaproteobacteria bacterium]